MKYKVGDKVLFGNQVVEITQIFDSGKCMVSNGWLQNSIWMDDLDPYKSAHDKLIELGWELKFKNENGFIYEKEHLRLYILIKELSYSIVEYFEEDYNDDFFINTIVNLELSKVLTQYLEELK